MGCTSSNAKSQETNIIDTGKSHHHHHNKDSEELINDNFRKWLKQNRPLADDYVLHDILYSQQISSGQQQQQQQQQQIQQTYESIEHDYRTIVAKALDLLSDRPDIKTVNKLTKLLTKEISTASPKKVNKTIDILRQTADKLRDGKISLDHTTINGEQINGEVVSKPFCFFVSGKQQFFKKKKKKNLQLFKKENKKQQFLFAQQKKKKSWAFCYRFLTCHVHIHTMIII